MQQYAFCTLLSDLCLSLSVETIGEVCVQLQKVEKPNKCPPLSMPRFCVILKKENYIVQMDLSQEASLSSTLRETESRECTVDQT